MYSSYVRFLRKKILENRKKKFRKIFHEFFFFLQNFRLQIFFLQQMFFFEIFFRFFLFRAGGRCWRAKRAAGGVGERSEPPAGGLAVGAEGSVNSELMNKWALILIKHFEKNRLKVSTEQYLVVL